jgi:hypothetical protein
MLETLLPGTDGCMPPEAASESVVAQTCSNLPSDTAMSKGSELKAGAYTPLDLVSGAGHDALALAKLTKVFDTPLPLK